MARRSYATVLAGALGFMPVAAMAADHQDGPATTADPTSDITDVYAWTNADHTKVNLVMDVSPLATPNSKFSNAVQYVFHTSSGSAYGMTSGGTNVICTFDATQKISCWAGSEYVTGDASHITGLTSASGKLKVFAGLRDDPFFFNLDGFKSTAAAVHVAAGSLAFDAAGCPTLDEPNSTALVTQLKQSPTHAAPVDHFLGLNVLSIVLQLDTSILASGGAVVSIWGSTNHAS